MPGSQAPQNTIGRAWVTQCGDAIGRAWVTHCGLSLQSCVVIKRGVLMFAFRKVTLETV